MTNYYYYYYYYFTSTGLLIIRVKHIWVDLELSSMYVSMTPIHERKMITFLFFFSKFDFYIWSNDWYSFFFFFGKSMIGMSRIVFGSLGLIFSFPCRLLLGRGSWCNSGRPMLCFRPFSCDWRFSHFRVSNGCSEWRRYFGIQYEGIRYSSSIGSLRGSVFWSQRLFLRNFCQISVNLIKVGLKKISVI